MECAKESEKTKRAREKLAKKLAMLDEKVNAQALQRKTKEIHRWIDRQPARVVLKDKAFALFDGNQNPAPESRKVANLALRLGEDLAKPLESLLSEAKVV